MGFWIPFMMAASTAVTIMGQNQQKKNMKADAAWKKYEIDLNYHVQKQKELTSQTALLSEQRARSGASGTTVGSGSSLLVAMADQAEFENDMMLLGKGVTLQHGSVDSKLSGQMASANLNMLGTAIQGGTSIMSHNQQTKFMDAKYGKKED
tara:strand:+ start:636 stop:1088 length:453 start_codon:yes stop_codon:yes gene_type:complete